ncbi:MAG: hypothetical protein GY795_43055 [Desulfobacterales bacterium]|nr:hypothetical protein [Desulfobacterales bacterium]
MDKLTLAVDGNVYSGWLEATVVRSMLSLSGGFNIALTEKWEKEAVRWPIHAGAECCLSYDNQSLITGYVDDVDRGCESSNRSIKIKGRDKAGYLVDCSAMNTPSEFNGLKLEQIVKKLVYPFDLKVKSAIDTGEPFKSFKLRPGEKVFEAIERMCRLRAVLVVSDGNGNLVVTRACEDQSHDGLIEGKNILWGSAKDSWSGRYSEYVVKSQTRGSDQNYGEETACISAKAIDKGIGRYRPLMIIAESQADHVAAEKRAKWEAVVRAGRASSSKIKVKGFVQSNGEVWRPNSMVRVKAPELLDIEEELLITEVKFSLGNSGGAITTLTLARKDAFQLLPEIPKTKANGLPEGTEIVT